MGVRASAVGTELPFFRDTWRLRTLPQAGSGSGAVGLVREEPDRWGLATPPFPRSYGQLRGSCLAAVRVGIPVTGYRQCCWGVLASFRPCSDVLQKNLRWNLINLKY